MNSGDHNAADEYHDGNERDIEQKQRETVADTEGAHHDPEIDESAVQVLPGTGGPDDVGEIDLDPGDYHPKGNA